MRIYLRMLILAFAFATGISSHAQYQVDGNNCDANGGSTEWTTADNIYSDPDDSNTAGADIQNMYLNFDEATETFCYAFKRYKDGSSSSGPTSTYAIFFDTDCDLSSGSTNAFSLGADAALGFIWQQNNILDVEAFFVDGSSAGIVSSVYQGFCLCGDPTTDLSFAEFCASTDDLAQFLNFDPCGCNKITVTGGAVLAGGSFNSSDKDFIDTFDNFCIDMAVIPSAIGTVDVLPACEGQLGIDYDASASLVGLPGTTVTWDFGDGNTSTSIMGTHSYTTAGTYTVTLTVMDAKGCPVDTTFPVVAEAFVPPVADKANLTVDACALTINYDGSTSTDNNGADNLIYNWTFSNEIEDLTATGVSGSMVVPSCDYTSVTLVVTDPDATAPCNTNMTSCDIVFDIIDPAANCPALTVTDCILPSPYATITEFEADGGQVIDDCNNNISITLLSSGDAQTCGTAIQRVYEFEDGCGNSGRCTQDITIDDNLAPSFTVPPTVNLACGDPGPFDLNYTGEPSGLSDNCASPTDLVIEYMDDFSLVMECTGGTLIRTWTVTDPCGNSSSQDQTIEFINDQDPPVLGQQDGFPADVTLSCDCVYPYIGTSTGDPDASACFAGTAVPFETPSVMVCFDMPISSDYVDDLSGIDPCNGTGVIMRTWSIFDFCNNPVTMTQRIVIEDPELPDFADFPSDITITCKDDITDLDVTGRAPLGIDNCSSDLTITYVDNNGAQETCDGSGSIIRTWTVTDDCSGLPNSRDQIITISNNFGINVECPTAQVTIACTDEPLTTLTGEPTEISSECYKGATTFTFDDGDGKIFSCGSAYVVNRIWTATTACGDESIVCNQTITAIDDVAPIFAAPSDIVISCADDATSLAVTGNYLPTTYSDNCSTEALSVSHDDLDFLGNCNGTGHIERTWTITDQCGNTATELQIITVEDNSIPTADFPANIEVSCEVDISDTSITGAPTNIMDNCRTTDFFVVFENDTISFGCNGEGMIDRKWIVSDRCSPNNLEYTQRITIVDNTKPFFTVPADITIECEVDDAFNTTTIGGYDYTDTGFITDHSDNCTPQEDLIMEVNDVEVDYDECTDDKELGYIERTWTVTDACGNATSLVQTITIADTTPPVAKCKDVSVHLPDSGNSRSVIIDKDDFNNGSSDVCSSTVSLSMEFEDRHISCADPLDCVPEQTVQLFVEDNCGNISSCFSKITVTDNPPEISCPPDPAPVQLETGQCSASIIFELPSATDDCYPGDFNDAITRTDENYTENPDKGCIPDDEYTPRLLTSNDNFPIGITTLSYMVTDCRGRSASCDINIEVIGYEPITDVLACNDQVNVSLDNNCCHRILVDDILEGDEYRCTDCYEINVTDQAGNSYGDVLTSEMIGQNLNYSIKDTKTGNSCWGKILVEDKIPPQITCNENAIIVNCGDAIIPDSLGFPVMGDSIRIDDTTWTIAGGDNCNSITLSYEDEEINADCRVDGYIRKIHRRWTATDAGGKTATCVDTIRILQVPFTADNFPPDYGTNEEDEDAQPELSCERQTFTPAIPNLVDSIGWNVLDNGHPSPFSIYYPAPNDDIVRWYGTGVPNGLECGGSLEVEYSDQRIDVCENTFKIIRTWTILNWCTGEIYTDQQLIKVSDTKGPIINCPDEPFFSTDIYECVGDAMLNPPTVIFECSSTTTYSIAILLADDSGDPPVDGQYEGDDIIYQMDEPAKLNDLPLNRTWIRYTVYDACGNIEQCFTEVTIEDQEAPIPVCDQFTVISLGIDGCGHTGADSFDDGSYDQCSDTVWFKARKDSEAFDDQVKLCCADLGRDEIIATMRVYDVDPGEGVVDASRHLSGGDLYGRYRDCTVFVEVQDKFPPQIDGPSDITISCDYPMDPDDMSEFGTIVLDEADRGSIFIVDPFFSTSDGPIGRDGYAIDNCSGISVMELDAQIAQGCVGSTVTRRWEIKQAGQTIRTVTQTITKNVGTQFTINDTTCDNADKTDNVVWPCSIVLDECHTDAAPDPAVTGSPLLVGSYCGGSSIVVDYKDQVFEIADGCAKVLREWTIVDWCTYNPNANDDTGYWTYEQVIKYDNTQAPVISGSGTITAIIEDNGCTANINFDLMVEDDCAALENLDITYTIDLDSDGSIDLTGSSVTFNENLQAGNHIIHWQVSDRCDNIATHSETLIIRDTKKPTIYCHTQLSTAFMDAAQAMIEIWANDLVISATDNCDEDLDTYGIVRSADNPNNTPSNNPSIILTCEDIKDGDTVSVQVWVQDDSGNWEYCTTTIQIQYNDEECPDDEDETCNCSEEFDPVCGDDGNTYTNSCVADCVGITYTQGECDPQGCECSDEVNSVCGSDGNTYDNSCLAECAGVTWTLGECVVDPCENCPTEVNPVCGSDGVTYDNSCLAECAGVPWIEGECVIDPCDNCPTDDSNPVCGSDGITYNNSCLAECAGVTWTDGTCPTGDLPSNIVGIVWCDSNNSSILENSDDLLASIPVSLLDENGNTIRDTITDENGAYIFGDVPPGTYSVQFTIPDNKTYIFADGCDIADQSGSTLNFVVNGNGQDIVKNACTKFQFGDIIGYAWCDTDCDGIRDADESIKVDATITVYSANGEFLAVTWSKEDGNFEINNVLVGDYYIEVDGIEGYTFTLPNQGDDENLDSDIDNTFGPGTTGIFTVFADQATDEFGVGFKEDIVCPAVVNPVCGSDGMTYTNSCEAEKAGVTWIPGECTPTGNMTSTITGVVWCDSNINDSFEDSDDRLASLLVQLYDVNGDLVNQMLTNVDGEYAFTDVQPGMYYVQFAIPDNKEYLFAEGCDVSDQNGRTLNFMVDGDGATIIKNACTKFQFGNVSGFVWCDLDCDGIRDADEPLKTDVTITIYSSTAQFLAEAWSKEDGNFEINSILVGDYYIQVEGLDGYTFTAANQGDDDTIDSDIDNSFGVGTSRLITILADQTIENFGVGLKIDDDGVASKASGKILTENQNPIGNVEVSVMTKDADKYMMNTMSDDNGGFAFSDVTDPHEYYLQPKKNTDHLNGLSTLDIVLIQRHILGLSALDSPYKVIAADINNSQSVTASDLVHLRKIILGLTDHFPNNTSWRFVDQFYNFEDEQNPWPFAETTDMQLDPNNDFIGIKIGDVNLSHSLNGNSTEPRSNDNYIVIQNQDVYAEEIIEIPVSLSTIHNHGEGFQFEMKYNMDLLELIDLKGLEEHQRNFVNINTEGSLKISWNEAQTMNLQEDHTLFTMVARVKKDGNLKENFGTSSMEINNEFYTTNLTVETLTLEMSNINVGQDIVLFQNQPNPFSEVSSIKFYIPSESDVNITVYDALGQIYIDHTKRYDSGMNDYSVSKSDLDQSKIYFYSLRSGDQVITKKMILLD